MAEHQAVPSGALRISAPTTYAHYRLFPMLPRFVAAYQSVFGGQIAIVTYKDAGNVQDPSDADHVMWGQVDAPNGFRAMAYDVPAATPWAPGENAYFVSVRGDAAEEVALLWKKLAQGATILSPLEKAQWSPL